MKNVTLTTEKIIFNSVIVENRKETEKERGRES